MHEELWHRGLFVARRYTQDREILTSYSPSTVKVNAEMKNSGEIRRPVRWIGRLWPKRANIRVSSLGVNVREPAGCIWANVYWTPRRVYTRVFARVHACTRAHVGG